MGGLNYMDILGMGTGTEMDNEDPMLDQGGSGPRNMGGGSPLNSPQSYGGGGGRSSSPTPNNGQALSNGKVSNPRCLFFRSFIQYLV